MAKKKKGSELIANKLRGVVTQQPANKTTNLTGRTLIANKLQSATKKAEEERSSRMRQGLSSVVRSLFNRQMSQPTRVQKSTLKPLAVNALAPVKSTAQQTRSQQSKYLNTDLQRKGLNTPMSQLMAGKTNVGVEQGKALRAGMPTNSNVIESWRQTATNAEKKAREKYGYGEDFFNKQINERLDNSGKKEVFDPSNGKITTALPARMNATAPNEATYMVGDALRGMRWDDIRSGFSDAFARKNVEDTAERQFGRTVDDDTLARLEEQRSTLGYGTGMAAGQMAQYALTRGMLSGAGLVGRGAKAADTAGKAFRAEMAIDQAASVPLNLIDAMKEDNLEGIVKRFGLNQGLDLVFGAFTEGISIKRNPLYQNAETKHIAAREARQAGDNAAANALDQSARRDLGAISNDELDEARNDIVARVGEQRRIINDEQVNAIQNAEGTVGEFPSTDYAYRNGSDRANYDNMRDDMLGAIESQEAIGAGDVPNNIGIRAEARPYQPTTTPKTGVEKVLSDYNTSADELIARIEDPYFDDLQMLDNIADDLFPVGKKRSMEIDAERAYSDNLKAFEEDPALFDGYRPTREEAYMDVLSDNVVDELRRSQTPNVADDVARAVPTEQTAREATQQTARAVPAENTARRSAEQSAKNESVEDATERLIRKWGNTGNETSYREIVKQYNGMSAAELKNEKEALQRMANTSSIDPDEAADRIAVIDAIAREKNGATSNTSSAWDDIPNVAKSDEAPQDLMKANPHRKESGIPKYSDQKTRKEVLFRGETADRNGAKETAEQVAETPKKRNQVKGILGEEKAEKSAVEKQADWDEFDVKEAERKGRETVKREKKASEKYGDYPGGMPKRSAEGEELSKGADTLLSRDDSIVHEDVQLRGMEGVTNEGAGRKTTQKFNASLESAHERYKSDPQAFKERLKNARESVRNGKFPEGYDNPQDFISDEAELQKQFTRRLNAMEEGSEEYWDLVDEAWEYAQDAIAGGSQAGGYLRQYQAFIDAHPGVKAASIDKTLKRLYRQNEKRLKKIGIDEDTFIKNALPKEMRTAILTAETKEEASKAWAKASIHVWNQIPASLKEKVDFLRINAMLLNPKTHIRNIFGNALFVPMRELKNLTGTGLEYIAQKAGVLDKAARTKAIIPDKAAMKIAKDVRKNNPAIRGASRLLENLANGRPLESGMTFMAGRQNANAVINGVRKFLDKTGNANAWLLEHEDFLFFNGAFDRQFGRITKARGLTADDLLNNPKLLDDVTEAATEEALRATYRDESAAARIISKWKNPPKNASATRKAAGLALDAILPFTKTPINILRRAVDYSPAGAGKGIYHLARGIHDGNQKMIVRGLDQLSSAIPGTGLAMLGWFMSENDGVTAKLGSDKDDQFMKDLGKQNFSIVFNAGTDKEWSYTLDWAAPGCIPFFTGVAFKEMSDEGVDFWEAADAFEQMLEPMTEMSVMQGIKNTLETFQRESGGGVMQGLTSVGINTGLSYVGQFKPTLVSQAARTIDPVRRDTTSTAESASKRQIERWWNKQKAGIPGLSKTLNPYQNVWGETEKNTYNDNLPMRIVENFFSPGYAKKYKADSVDKEIIKLYQQDPSADGVIPTKFSKYEIGFDGGTVRFSTDDRSNFIKVQGKVSKQDLHKLFDSQEYKNASLTDKQKMIANVYSDAKGQAKRDTLLKMGKDEWKVYTDDFDTGSRKKDYSDAKAAGIKADQYYELMTNKDWDLDENGSPMKSELALYLNADDNLTDEQRSVIFSKLASGNTKNPYEDGTAHTTDWQAEYDAKKNKGKNSSGSSKSKSKSKGGRSGGRSGGSSGKTKARAKTASEKRFASLQKMKAPTTGEGIEALANSASGLTKSQKKALVKLLQKKLDV